MQCSDRRGFTRTDLCVVIIMLVLVVGLLLPLLGRTRDANGHRVACMNNQMQIALASIEYGTMTNHMPNSISLFQSVEGQTVVSWVQPLLGQLGRADLAEHAVSLTSANAPNIPILICPSDRNKVSTRGGPLSYVVNSGSFKHWHADGSVDYLDRGAWGEDLGAPSRSITMSYEYVGASGASLTISLSENIDARSFIPTSTKADYEDSILWDPSASLGFNQDASNGRLDNEHARPSSFHPGGAVVAFLDGHVLFISDTIDYKVYATLMAVGTMTGSRTRKTLVEPSVLSGFLVSPLDASMIPTQ